MEGVELKVQDVAVKSAKGALLNFGSAGITKVATLLFYIVMLRFVSAAEGGVYFLYVAVTNIIAMASAFGMTDSLARFIPFYEGSGKKDKVKSLVFTVFISFLAFSAIVFIIMTNAKDAIAAYYSKELASIMFITILTALALSLNLVLSSTLLGMKKFGVVAFYSAMLAILKLVLLGGFFMLLGYKLDSALYATFFSLVLVDMAALASVLLSLRKLPGKIELLAFREMKEIASYGIAVALNQFSSYFMGWTDTIVLTYYVTNAIVGAYNSAIGVARTLMTTISTQIHAVILSMLSHLHGAKSNIFGPLASNAARWSVYLTLPIAIAGIFFAKEEMNILFPNYAEYFWLLYILIPGFFISVLSLPARGALSAVGRTDLLFKSTLIGVIPNIVLNIVLIPIYGVSGAAASTILSYTLSELVALFYANRIAKFSIHPLVAKVVVPGVAMVLIMVLSYKYLFDFSARGKVFEVVGMALASGLSGVVYLSTLFITGAFNNADYKLVDNFVKKVRSLINLQK